MLRRPNERICAKDPALNLGPDAVQFDYVTFSYQECRRGITGTVYGHSNDMVDASNMQTMVEHPYYYVPVPATL